MGLPPIELWQRAQEIVSRSLELEADERSAYLESNAGDDAELREEVLSIVEAHAQVDRFLETPALRAWARWYRHEASRIGQNIGPYKILRQIGEGGMGKVYLAVRDDDEYRKEVAIKLVEQHVSSGDVLRRFRSERQILASLDHPNIARLHDGGTIDDGSPYLVMEYVEGSPIDQHCDERRLSVAERLKLFRPVCAALLYAHQRLVVHRDLKPKNILVTADGVPKLLDFGIAKLLDPSTSSEATRTTLRPMTLNYASPEQILGGEITLATDVYSLGVVLYELLTGRLPRRLAASSVKELEGVLMQEPLEPSLAVLTADPDEPGGGSSRPPSSAEVGERRRVSPRQLHRKLAGDIDNIVLTALRADAEHRYASVEQLAEDLDRHAAGLPVKARRATLGYRAGKFLRRNRVFAGAIAVVVALVAGSLVASVRHSRQIARERDQVQSERQKAERVATFLVELLQDSDPYQSRGNDPTVLEILDGESEDLLQRFESQPLVRARLLDVMGTIYRNRGSFEKSQPLLEKALELRRQILGSDHPEVAASLTHLGELQSFMLDYEAAEVSHLAALATRRRLFGDEHSQVAESLHHLGRVSYHRGDLDQMESRFREAFELRSKLLGGDHPVTAESLGQLALALFEKGEHKNAEPLYRDALAIFRRHHGNDHPDVAAMLNNLGGLLSDSGDLAGAAALHREALELRRQIFGPEHPEVGQSINNLAVVLRNQGELDEAEALFRQGLDIARRVMGEEHHYVALVEINIASVHLMKGEDEKAEALLRHALEIERKVLPETHPGPAWALAYLARIRMKRGEPLAAEPLYREAVERRHRGLPPDHPLTIEAEGELRDCLVALGRLDEAQRLRTGTQD